MPCAHPTCVNQQLRHARLPLNGRKHERCLAICNRTACSFSVMRGVQRVCPAYSRQSDRGQAPRLLNSSSRQNSPTLRGLPRTVALQVEVNCAAAQQLLHHFGVPVICGRATALGQPAHPVTACTACVALPHHWLNWNALNRLDAAGPLFTWPCVICCCWAHLPPA